METGTFWDGAGGAMIGSAGSALVAIAVVVWTRNSQRKLMREEMSVTNAYECQVFVFNLRARVDRFIRPGPPVDWTDVKVLDEGLERDGQRIYLFTSMIGPRDLDHSLSELWESLCNEYPPRIRSAYEMRSERNLDDVARDLGQHLTNVGSDLEMYLRAEHDRDRWRRLRFWRRFKLQKAWPFLRRRTLVDALAEHGKAGGS